MTARVAGTLDRPLWNRRIATPEGVLPEFIARDEAHTIRRRAGMTLVELLVVVTIIVILMAVSVPLLRPAIKEGHLREASRQVNVFVAGAKARAAQLGREAGIMIKRTAPGANSARELYLVESPLPYSGDIADSSVATLLDSDSDGRSDSASFQIANSGSLLSLVSIGDSIQFDFKGPRFRINNITQPGGANTTIFVYFSPPASAIYPGCDGAWGVAGVDDNNDMIIDNGLEAYWSGSDDGPHPPAVGTQLSYQITRQPTRSTSNVLQLSVGTCIDLEFSGMSASGVQFAAANSVNAGNPVLDDEPIVILFNPSGSISRVYYGLNNGASVTLQEATPTGTVYLLVGRLEQAAPPPPATRTAEITNLADVNSTWIAVADRTGTLTVAENDAPAAASGGVLEARSLARSGLSMGGR